jgi:cytochrome c biogenesis protein CcmG/thiol:disulfide interchange protein DsbE
VKRALFLAVVLLLVAFIGFNPFNHKAASLTSHARTGTVVSCSKITVDKGVSKGVSLPCLDSKTKVLYQSIRGPVVVNVFGSWCEPCNQEIPHFLDLQALHKVAIVGIDVEERNMQAGRNFVIKKGMTWPVLYDTNSVTRGIFGFGVPVTWFINAQGKVVYKQIGLITSTSELTSEVSKYLKIKL